MQSQKTRDQTRATALLEQYKQVCPPRNDDEVTPFLNSIIEDKTSIFFYKSPQDNLNRVESFIQNCSMRKAKLTEMVASLDMKVSEYRLLMSLMRRSFNSDSVGGAYNYETALINAPSVELKQIVLSPNDREHALESPSPLEANKIDESAWNQLDGKFKGESPLNSDLKTLLNLKVPVPKGMALQAYFILYKDPTDEEGKITKGSALLLRLIQVVGGRLRKRRRKTQRRVNSKRKTKQYVR